LRAAESSSTILDIGVNTSSTEKPATSSDDAGSLRACAVSEMAAGWRRLDGRWLTAALLVGYFAGLFVYARGEGRSLRQAWNAVGVSARDPVFGDLRIIPDAAEAAGEGRDPYGDDIRDHRRRRFNYPRLWLSTYGMGLTSGRVEIVGTGIAAAFLGLTFVVMGPLTLMQGCLWAALVCAPATMLGVERGNLDLIMFCLLALALLSRRRPPLAAGFILAASLGKLFPAASFLVFANRPARRTLVMVGTCLLVFAVYLYFTRDDLSQIGRATLRSASYSYGCAILVGLIQLKFGGGISFAESLAVGWVAALAVCTLAGLRARGKPSIPATYEREVIAFLIGAPIMIGTFLLGTSFDYRWVFGLYCVPLWLRLGAGRGPLAPGSRGALACLTIYLYWFLIAGEGTTLRLLFKQILAWVLLYQIAYSLAVILRPAWSGWRTAVLVPAARKT
jgi:hypothetical protein